MNKQFRLPLFYIWIFIISIQHFTVFADDEIQTIGTNDYFNSITELYYSLDYNDENYEELLETIKESLLSYFKSKESLNCDIEKDLPFLEYTTSSDGLIRLYGFQNHEGGTFISYSNILQFGLHVCEPKALFISDLLMNNSEFQFASINYYYDIIILKDNIYILIGNTRVSSWKGMVSFISIELTDNTIELYHAFNDFPFIFFYASPPEVPFPAKIREYFVNTAQEKRIDIFYDNNIDSHSKLSFVFDGTEFVGDYEKLYLLAE